jgi:hypothetical protein
VEGTFTLYVLSSADGSRLYGRAKP